MYLRAYDVDLATARAVEVSTMFLRGKAQDWWTGQFSLQASGSVPVLDSWNSFVAALTDAFRPVELKRRYMEQLMHLSQGKGDMRTYIASFNALRAKIPGAFSEEALSFLFLQGCRPDLVKSITLQYPKTLAEHIQHAIALSDIPGQTNPQYTAPKGPAGPPADKPKKAPSTTCTHCHKPGHIADRCFSLHPEVRKQRPKPSPN
jgi:hypothetical protein